jgi:hypothetical protein
MSIEKRSLTRPTPELRLQEDHRLSEIGFVTVMRLVKTVAPSA